MAQPQVGAVPSHARGLPLDFLVPWLSPASPSPLVCARTNSSGLPQPGAEEGQHGADGEADRGKGGRAGVPSRAGLPRGPCSPALQLPEGRMGTPYQGTHCLLSSAAKPEHNFPGCHSNSSGKAYYL